jgi:hypothetical protein
MSCHNYIILDELVGMRSGRSESLQLNYVELRHGSQTVDDVRIAGTKEELLKLADFIKMSADAIL